MTALSEINWQYTIYLWVAFTWALWMFSALWEVSTFPVKWLTNYSKQRIHKETVIAIHSWITELNVFFAISASLSILLPVSLINLFQTMGILDTSYPHPYLEEVNMFCNSWFQIAGWSGILVLFPLKYFRSGVHYPYYQLLCSVLVIAIATLATAGLLISSNAMGNGS